jgi:hypothetical protein
MKFPGCVITEREPYNEKKKNLLLLNNRAFGLLGQGVLTAFSFGHPYQHHQRQRQSGWLVGWLVGWGGDGRTGGFLSHSRVP